MAGRRIKTRKLSRTQSQRQALLKSLATALVINGSIVTTKPKAKAVIPFVERLITKAKQGGMSAERLVARRLGNGQAVTKLFDELLPRLTSRNSGHLKTSNQGFRPGDMAPLTKIEIILDPKPTTSAKPKATRPATSNTKAKQTAKKG